MLVIKMLKRISKLNNQELAELLGKSRNTIASWEKDETTIPETEKKKLNAKFNILPFYWNIGLNESPAIYKQMYQNIKEGYERVIANKIDITTDPIEKILNVCEQEKNNKNNELEHYLYLQSLCGNIDPINGQNLINNHFIHNEIIKTSLNNICNEIQTIFEDKYNNSPQNKKIKKDKDKYFNILKQWRIRKAKENKIKTFQIISDSILEEIIINYLEFNNPFIKRIKNFPIGGQKYNLYAKEIKELLENED